MSLDAREWLPDQAMLAELLEGSGGDLLPRVLQKSMLAPAIELVQRPSKRIRAELVSFGARLTAAEDADPQTILACSAAVELLHAGSLMVDDVQDGSPVRRGAPAIHLQFGVPRALCTGNWLYFWPLRIIRRTALPPDRIATACMLYQEAVEKAHYGQALDLSVRVDELARTDVIELARAVLELKTGAITALAMSLGAATTGAPARAVTAVSEFGRRLGVALQILDDFGNLIGKVDPEKRSEDLRQRKLSGVWLHVASESDDSDYEEFKQAVRRLCEGDDAPLDRFVRSRNLVDAAVRHARAELERGFEGVQSALGLPVDAAVVRDLRQLAEGMIHAYF